MKHKKSADDGELPAHAPTGLPDDFNADEDIGIGDSYSLRGLIHYRCIIEQVEKMLGGAGSGHELLSRIADCVQAHQQANEKSESFDRNVSVDNELSYPKLDVTEGDSVGRLTDQGLSVNLEGTCRSLQREQPEIGQFSSYAIAISRYIYFHGRSKLAVVADDLESFWYILLYHAILRIRSNCSGWAIWIQFFQSHLAILERELAVRFGVLEIRGVGKLSFKDATINGVIYDLLGLFPAHYKVVEYDRRRKLHPSDKNPPPTGAELALAENVKDHEMFLEILEKALISLR
ncbi:hypothetical protein DICSQDRAFT_174913 [Dichomitus squalens LYAD-421 SS1]|uniref:Fungal-type protein kinase domain-containing protein n=1 Tax=Dichomitus squalens (strain LYAD-421) TaxID=732165 RepID=R7SKX8_DICSQ|nr:uncharacterized protein DICSQDRAFT_174913 [Dichomitus squalens LYAD-421 SS1]EJF56395.1 hypothetical protein DICSQDRAFT_174913 [Dichomitus squalens LYAD-421 SS1]